MEQIIQVLNQDINFYKSGKGNNIIFLHGWGQSYKSFSNTYSVLEKNYCVYGLDFPGFGKSEDPKKVFTIFDYEKILEEFIKINNIKNPTIIAHSFGGRVAIIYASKNNNINKMILTGAAGIKPRKNITQRLKEYHYKFMKFLVSLPIYKQYRNDLLKTSGSIDYKNANNMMKKVLVNVVNCDLTEYLNNINTNTLLYWGEEDEATPLSDGIIMRDRLINSELVIVKGYGHYAYLENSKDFNKNITSFLKI